ncbi:hypothetical protein X798_01513 [Onchocerca flexuosa]|uniref:G-patch domain-containing protein n=1 Tax=Onchocerca flexuosa TaxID=387005 RepID=A0A238C3L0_9BILA|nr:hypothetical protein X798_01513 [Onchocerca flexuosa]
MADWVIYGTELEEVSDGTNSISNTQPLRIEEQVVKDEKGRKRFHGAFTGGFSAGYFNTVGSKEGNNLLFIHNSLRDLSEFGIAARRIKISANVGGDNSDKQLLAWERNAQSSFESSLAVHLQKIIKPTRNSIGIQLLKKMGWREGHGIGSKMSRKALEKQKLNDDRIYGKRGFYNEGAVREADEMAPNFLFAPSDFDPTMLKSSEGVHGLGYCGIRQTSVFSEKYGILESTLKLEKKGKGISGQAFGVGAFENDDANIYTNYDLSQYDFAIDSSGTAPDASCNTNDTSFVMASKRQLARNFFEPPRIPSNFLPLHVPIHPDISQMPLNIKQFSEKMNHLQRAKFLGETDPKPVLELIRDEDRKRLNISHSEDVIQNTFEENPMKQARFKQYVNYLKRGLNYPQPSDMTRLEWDQELQDFQNVLPPELQSLISEVERQQKPLACPDIAAPIADVLKSKFISSSSSNSGKMKETESNERFAATKMKMFGIKTRLIHEWHPAKQLAKRFNVPDPYPSSSLLGVPHLQKTIKSETLANLGAHMLTFESTIQDPKYHSSLGNINISKTEETFNEEETNSDQKPSEELLKAIFGDSDESSTDTENEELQDNQEEITVPSMSANFFDNRTEESKFVVPTKMLTVMDMDLSSNNDNEEFGPVPPPSISSLTVDLRTNIIDSNKKSKFCLNGESIINIRGRNEKGRIRVQRRKNTEKIMMPSRITRVTI